MPTYEYECPKGHSFEAFQKMTDEPLAKCPECGAKARRKISGGAGFLFKGEGFYITDYRSEDYKKKASSETGESSSKPEKSEKSEKSEKKDKGESAPSDRSASGSKASKSGSDE
ncbi:MAG TPA: zinc ribbon domain-containing protein [Longimicrobiales bacterium]|nr:zinc ribbon domain-containing protein [Longimicrobiales bacterium]